jgi:hypothetical protein
MGGRAGGRTVIFYAPADSQRAGHPSVCLSVRQIRNALAIGQALGRAVVMPKLWCGLDRWWAPHKGNLPDSDMSLPYQCPLDHVFDLTE